MARTGAEASPISREVQNGNAALDRSAPVRRASSSRERGPITPSTAATAVTSVSAARAVAEVPRRIQSASWVAAAAVGDDQYASSARRVTVRSHSMPPRRLSICV